MMSLFQIFMCDANAILADFFFAVLDIAIMMERKEQSGRARPCKRKENDFLIPNP